MFEDDGPGSPGRLANCLWEPLRIHKEHRKAGAGARRLRQSSF